MPKQAKSSILGRKFFYIFSVFGLCITGMVAAFTVGTYADAEADLSVARLNFGHLLGIETFLEGYQEESKPFVASYGSSLSFLVFGPIWLIGKIVSNDFSLVSPEAMVARNLATFIIALIGLGAVLFWFRLIFNKLPTSVVLLAPISIPVWFGMSFMDSKDIPLTSGFAAIIALYALILDRASKAQEEFLSIKVVILTHVSIIFTIGVRPISAVWVIPPLIFLGYLQVTNKLSGLKPFLISCVSSFIYIVFTNYYLLTDPIFWVKNLFGMGENFPWVGAILSWGKLYRSPEIPRMYTIEMLASQLPLFVLWVLVVGIFLYVSQSRRNLLKVPASIKLTIILLLSVIVQTLVQSPVLYDNARQLLFLHMLVFILALWIFETNQKKIRQNFVVWSILIFFLSVAVVDGIKLYPYNYIYRNEIARQLPGGSFETDYWGISGREMSNWIIGDAINGKEKSATVAYIFPQSFSSYIKKSNLVSVPLEDLSARYYAQIWRPGLLPDYSAQCPIVFSVDRSFLLGKTEILGYVRKCE